MSQTIHLLVSVDFDPEYHLIDSANPDNLGDAKATYIIRKHMIDQLMGTMDSLSDTSFKHVDADSVSHMVSMGNANYQVNIVDGESSKENLLDTVINLNAQVAEAKTAEAKAIKELSGTKDALFDSQCRIKFLEEQLDKRKKQLEAAWTENKAWEAKHPDEHV